MDRQLLSRNSHLQKSTTSKTASAFGPIDDHKNWPIFLLNQVSVFLSGQKILSDLNLKIHRGDFVFISGPTGAGKTTLLRFLYGELPSYRGEYLAQMNHQNHSQGKELFLARIYQDLKVFHDRSLKDNLMLAYDPSVYQSRAEFLEQAIDYCQLFNMEKDFHRSLDHLSGGGRQKVAIIRTLLGRPDILIADEPTSNLDRQSSIKLFEVLSHLNQKKRMTVIWATHNYEFVRNFSGRLIQMEQGKFVYQM
ncbi:MAG: ATP-binding cassette domain-containing protein [Bacteriovoracaceae bacterium]|nr:ATP-binding cassette domain-containing protein [Bacteriovoracaceae bacterium]